MSDLIDRQAAIDALYDWSEHSMTDAEAWHIRQVIGDIKSMPPAEPNCSEIPNNSDCISRQAAITAIQKVYADTEGGTDKCAVWKNVGLTNALHIMQDLPSAQPEQRYTEEELRVFRHGISLSLLSKRSAQHWHYDDDTATEIEFLERLYEKVGADMRGDEDE